MISTPSRGERGRLGSRLGWMRLLLEDIVCEAEPRGDRYSGFVVRLKRWRRIVQLHLGEHGGSRCICPAATEAVTCSHRS